MIRAIWNASWLSSLGNAIKIKFSLEGQDHLSLQSQSASYWNPFRTLQYQTMMYLCVDAWCTRPWCTYVLMPAIRGPAIPDHDSKQILLHDSLCKSVDVFCRSRSSGAHQDAWTRYIHLDADGRMDIEDYSYPNWKTFPLWCCFSIIHHIIKRLKKDDKAVITLQCFHICHFVIYPNPNKNRQYIYMY